MANYKLVNADQLDADLESVADKIREKAELTDQLVFPSGFIEGIDQCSSLNFSVVGGTTQPSDPKENTIWVNTSTEITGWVISPEQPIAPEEGMVWIVDGDFSDYVFNALKKNEIKVYPKSIKQYIKSSWTDITESEIYQGGAWKPFAVGLVIYDSGTFGKSPSGATYSVKATDLNGGGTYASVTNNSDHMLWSNNGALGLFYVDRKISCEGYKTLNISVSDANINTDSAYPGKWGLISTINYREPGFVASTGFDSLIGDHTLSLDVSSVGSTEYYAAMQFSAGSNNSAKITKIWLE